MHFEKNESILNIADQAKLHLKLVQHFDLNIVIDRWNSKFFLHRESAREPLQERIWHTFFRDALRGSLTDFSWSYLLRPSSLEIVILHKPNESKWQRKRQHYWRSQKQIASVEDLTRDYHMRICFFSYLDYRWANCRIWRGSFFVAHPLISMTVQRKLISPYWESWSAKSFSLSVTRKFGITYWCSPHLFFATIT